MVRLLQLFLAAWMCAPSLQGMPVAVIAPSTLTAVCGQPIVFDGAASHCTDAHVIVDYRWEFPSGESLPGSQVSYVFPAHGVHRVELWITDASGRSAIAEVVITIQQGGPPVGAPELESELRFDPARLAVMAVPDGWAIVDTSRPTRSIATFPRNRKPEAARALQVLEHYRIDTLPPIGSSGLTLYLAAGKAPAGPVQDEQGVSFEAQALRVERRPARVKPSSAATPGHGWTLMDGTHPLWGFCSDEARAREALMAIRQQGLTKVNP